MYIYKKIIPYIKYVNYAFAATVEASSAAACLSASLLGVVEPNDFQLSAMVANSWLTWATDSTFRFNCALGKI